MSKKTWTVDAATLAKNGPIVDVELFAPGGEAVVRGKALIDTGAGCTSIPPKVAEALGLQKNPIMGESKGMNDEKPRPTPWFRIKIHLPDIAADCEFKVMGAPGIDDRLVCTIGRDLLHDLSLSLEFDGPKGSFSLATNATDQ